MFASSKITFAGIVAVVAGVVSAAPNPTEPSSTSVFNIGSTCSIKWDADATGAWKKMSIQLMTGDNWNMVHITTVAQNIDATDATKNSFTYTCPEVTPTSAIYFYQFTDPSAPKDLLWTTRFTLAAADGSTTPPTESTQPNGDSIPWGKGALVDPSKAVAAPAYLGANQAGTVTGTASGTVSATPAGSSSAPVTTPVASAPPTRSTSASGSVITSVVRASGGAPSASGSAAASSPSANAAIGGVVPGMMAVVGAVLAAAGMI